MHAAEKSDSPIVPGKPTNKADLPVATVLNQIYEVDFLGFGYGFRPGRGQHDALDALATGIEVRKVNWILDADIASFFDSLSQEWLLERFSSNENRSRLFRSRQRT